MTLLPLNDRIKVQRVPTPNAPKQTIYRVPDSVQDGPQYAKVVAVPAPVATPPTGYWDALPLPVKQGITVGSTVVLGANVGICIPESGTDFYYVLPGDFLAVVEPSATAKFADVAYEGTAGPAE